MTLLAEPHPDGGQRWWVDRYTCDPAVWQHRIERLGWTVYLSNAPTSPYLDLDLVLAYRRQPRLEQQHARLKSRTLHIRLVFLHDEQRIQGLTWLLFLALRALVLLEFRVRRELARRDAGIVGLNPASKTQATRRPTAQRLWQYHLLGGQLRRCSSFSCHPPDPRSAAHSFRAQVVR